MVGYRLPKPANMRRGLALLVILAGTAILVFGIGIALSHGYDTARGVHISIGLFWVLTAAAVGAAAD
jgi:hypothetical protein